MHSIRKTMAAGLLMLGAGLSGQGCVDNDSTLFIYGIMDLTSTECLAHPDSSAVLLAGGAVDRAFAYGYQAAILVGSHLTQRGSREKLRTETSRLSITGAHVTLYGTNGATIEFDTPATGLVNPASGTDPGLAAMFARLIRIDDLGKLGPDGQIIARVKVFGTTLGGQDIESGEYDFPITLCTGCLVSYPSDAINPSTFLCDASSDKEQEDTICFFGQDRSFPCTYCASYSEICLDPAANPSINPAAGTP